MYKVSIVILLFVTGLINAQIVDIPDENFKSALVNDPVADLGDNTWGDVDTNNDGEIQVSEAEAVQKLHINSLLIDSIIGINSFTNIIELVCAYNNLNEIDVSENLNLKVLNLLDNNLNDLDISANLSIEYLDFAHNNLSEIDLSLTTNLKKLFCDHNQLNDLDISQNYDLDLLAAQFNNISQLNLNQNPNLINVDLSHNFLQNIDLSQNINLSSIACENNLFETIDISQNQNLILLWCRNNSLLESLNLKNGFNENFVDMLLEDNINLFCIEVDDVDYANQSFWHKDPWAEYSEDCSLGINENDLTKIILYPNPVNDVLYIDSTFEIKAITVYDILGRVLLIQENNLNSIDVSNLMSNLLLVEVESDKGTVIKKITKE